jgi:hypothetical protein
MKQYFQGIVDQAMADLSHQIDGPRDRRWFRRHPAARSYTRAPSKRELIAFGLPSTAYVLVFKSADGTRGRVFLVPDDTENVGTNSMQTAGSNQALQN